MQGLSGAYAETLARGKLLAHPVVEHHQGFGKRELSMQFSVPLLLQVRLGTATLTLQKSLEGEV